MWLLTGGNEVRSSNSGPYTMEPDRWRHVEELYHSARGYEPEQRCAFLAEVCQGDEDLRRLIDDLLSQSSATGGLVAQPAWELVARSAQALDQIPVGTKLGPYEIVGILGEGGMGKVYRALDARLDRAVALKFSAEQFSARFEREARAISALNHPNICTLYDAGSNYLVMELVEGETLAQRIERIGPLPLEEALEIGLQIAQALEAAHAKKIVHRDLKPANVKITPEGRIKVLDFGLAKSIRSEPAGESVPSPPSLAACESVAGQVLGTPGYMSPEQARGEDVDTRTDVWAFGCLVYELLTGKRAFRGGTGEETFTAILEREPDWLVLPPATPKQIRDLLQRCLEKNSVHRLQEIHAARAAIEDAVKPRTRVLTWGRAVAIGALVAAAALAVWFLRERDVQPEQMIHAVPLTTYPGSQDWPSFSPDGNEVAFSWDGENQDNFDIYVKPIGSGPLRRLTRDPAADTAAAWSPDGNSIAFLRAWRPGKSAVVLVPPQGGAERVVGEVSRFEPMNEGLGWFPDSKWLIVFDRPPNEAPGLWLISPETGERRRLTTAPDEGATSGDFVPRVAPDGRMLAFRRLMARNSSDLFLLPISESMGPIGEPRRLTRDGQVIDGLAWSSDGRDLVFSSGEPGNLRLFQTRISGTARRRLTEQGEILNLAISPRSQRLVFAQSRREMDIYRVELSGKGAGAHSPVPLIASSRLERYPSYSPDGSKIAFVSLRSGNWQLWVANSDGSNAVQMTSFERGEVAFPAWSPDGRQIGFASNPDGRELAYSVAASGGKPRKLDALGTNVWSWKWSRDGRWILFLSSHGAGQQLWRIPVAGGAPELLTPRGAATFAQSLDGKLIYYIRPGGIWCVPVEGGAEREVVKSDIEPGAIDVNRFGIYFNARSSVTRNGDLMFYRFPNGPVTKIAGVTTRYGLSASPDGRWLVYTKLTSTGSDLMLVDKFR
ncbi:MAG TPA: protein kinase [Bryobacteraceae bacterium]|nr:protein kinase [Bryobacteraceae bacterium]